MIYIIISKNGEIYELTNKLSNGDSNKQYELWKSMLVGGSEVPAQSNYKEIEGEFRLNKNIKIIPSEVFSYQNQGSPTEKDTVILIDGCDRYGYRVSKLFTYYEFNDYNDNPYNINKLKDLIYGDLKEIGNRYQLKGDQ